MMGPGPEAGRRQAGAGRSMQQKQGGSRGSSVRSRSVGSRWEEQVVEERERSVLDGVTVERVMIVVAAAVVVVLARR